MSGSPKKSSEGERFARLTQELLKSEAHRTLPYAARALLVLLAVGARPPNPMKGRNDKGNNGTQAITDKHARQYGFSSRDTVYRSLGELEARGLIVKTRDGWRSKTHFALYAVGWLPITHRDGLPLDVPESAPDKWRTWTDPRPKAKKKMPSDGRTSSVNLPSDSRTQSRPIDGQDRSICRPIVSRDEPICRPMVGNTLDISTHLPTTNASANGSNPGPQPSGLKALAPKRSTADPVSSSKTRQSNALEFARPHELTQEAVAFIRAAAPGEPASQLLKRALAAGHRIVTRDIRDIRAGRSNLYDRPHIRLG